MMATPGTVAVMPDLRVTERGTVPSLEPEDDPGIHGPNRATASRGALDCRVKLNAVRLRVVLIKPNAGAAAMSGRNPAGRDINQGFTLLRSALGLSGPCDPGSPCAAAAAISAMDSHGRMDHRTGAPWRPTVNQTLTGQPSVAPGNDVTQLNAGFWLIGLER
jgi:hypothetical protein